MPRFTKEHLFHVRPIGSLVEETHETGHELKRAVGPVSLTALGVGAIVGTGIFAVVGEGLARAGPAVIISFLLAAITCMFSALSYAELASSIPVAGSAYTGGPPTSRNKPRSSRTKPGPPSVTRRSTATLPRHQQRTTWLISPRTSRRSW